MVTESFRYRSPTSSATGPDRRMPCNVDPTWTRGLERAKARRRASLERRHMTFVKPRTEDEPMDPRRGGRGWDMALVESYVLCAHGLDFVCSCWGVLRRARMRGWNMTRERCPHKYLEQRGKTEHQPNIVSPCNPSIHPSVRPSVRPSIHYSSTYPCIHSHLHPFIHSFIHPPIHASTHASIHTYIHPSIHPSIHLSMHSFILPPFIYPHDHARIGNYVCSAVSRNRNASPVCQRKSDGIQEHNQHSTCFSRDYTTKMLPPSTCGKQHTERVERTVRPVYWTKPGHMLTAPCPFPMCGDFLAPSPSLKCVY